MAHESIHHSEIHGTGEIATSGPVRLLMTAISINSRFRQNDAERTKPPQGTDSVAIAKGFVVVDVNEGGGVGERCEA